jgi:Prealbumin-like fold domain
MDTKTLTQGRSQRTLLAALAIAAIALSLIYLARPVKAEGGSALASGSNTASIFIRKNDNDFNHLAGAVFSVEGVAGTMTTDENGGACFTGLPQDATLKVTEISPPPGYTLPDPNFQFVHVDNDGDCTSRDVLFVDTLVAGSQSASASASASTSGSASASASGSASASASGSTSASASGSASGSVSNASGSPEGGVQAATGAPGASFPNTASAGSQPFSPIAIGFALLMLSGMATLAYVNVATRRDR